MSFNWRMDQGNVVNLYSGILFSYLKTRTLPGLVAHTFNPSTWEAEAGEFLSLRPAWSTEWVPGQPGLYRETLSWKTTKIKNKIKKYCYYLQDWSLGLMHMSFPEQWPDRIRTHLQWLFICPSLSLNGTHHSNCKACGAVCQFYKFQDAST